MKWLRRTDDTEVRFNVIRIAGIAGNFLVVILLIYVLLIWGPKPLPSLERTLDIYQTTDMHGACFGNQGQRSMFAVLNCLTDSVNGNSDSSNGSILIDCGDFSFGSAESAVDSGCLALKIMNAVGYDAIVPGNHEFDGGKPHFITMMNRLKGSVLLGANLRAPMIPNLKPWTMIHRCGLKVALIGLVTGSVSEYILDFGTDTSVIVERDWNGAVRKIMHEILAQRPDVIGLACHSGAHTADGEVTKLIAEFPQIDFVLGGHSHENILGKRIGKRTYFVESGSHNERIAHLKAEVSIGRTHAPRFFSNWLKTSDTFRIPESLKEASGHLYEQLERIACPNPFIHCRDTKAAGVVFHRVLTETFETDASLLPPLRFFPEGESLSYRTLYTLFPFRDGWVTFSADRAVLEKIFTEQKKQKVSRRLVLRGVDLSTMKKRHRVRVVLPDFAAAGGGGHLPEIHRAVNSHEANRQIFSILPERLFGGNQMKKEE